MEAATALGVAAGLPAPAVPFLLATLSLPLVGFAHSRLLRGAGARNAASLALGLALSSTVYDWASTSQLLYPTAAAYVLMAVSRRHAGPLVFVVTFAYLIHWCGCDATRAAAAPCVSHAPAQPRGERQRAGVEGRPNRLHGCASRPPPPPPTALTLLAQAR